MLNAKDYGVPQNRERVFMVSILDCKQPYYFPKPIQLTKCLNDVVEDKVDEKCYLSDTAIRGFNRHAERQDGIGCGFGWEPTDGNVVANAITTHAGNRPTDNFIKVPVSEDSYRIRKLTHKECFRLMGVDDADSDKIIAVLSNTRCFQVAGNSIVVDVLAAIFDQLFNGNKNINQQTELF